MFFRSWIDYRFTIYYFLRSPIPSVWRPSKIRFPCGLLLCIRYICLLLDACFPFQQNLSPIRIIAEDYLWRFVLWVYPLWFILCIWVQAMLLYSFRMVFRHLRGCDSEPYVGSFIVMVSIRLKETNDFSRIQLTQHF